MSKHKKQDDYSMLIAAAVESVDQEMSRHTVVGVTVLPVECVERTCGCPPGKHTAYTIAACRECNAADQGTPNPSEWVGGVILAHTGGYGDGPVPKGDFVAYYP